MKFVSRGSESSCKLLTLKMKNRVRVLDENVSKTNQKRICL